MKRRRFIVETLDDGPYVTTADLLRRSTWLSVVQVAESPDAGARAGFIYDAGNGSAPCHAVLYDKDGPWSKTAVAFCGETVGCGPAHLIDAPQGGLCHACARFVEKRDAEHWVVIECAPLPAPARPRRHESFEED